jgi:L-ascorbate metabolism protein UlaG (beta-lactamase superfamily)
MAGSRLRIDSYETQRMQKKRSDWATAICAVAAAVCFAIPATTQTKREPQTFPTAGGAVVIVPIYHASALIEAAGRAIYIDPTRPGDYSDLPRADLILITSATPGHMDAATIGALSQSGTEVWGPQTVVKSIKHAEIISNGQSKQWQGWTIEAIPAYRLADKGKNRKGGANGYVLGYGGKRFYFSGDTGAVPEMLALRNIDVAFVCMSDTTMTAWEAAAAVQAFRPKIVIPYANRGTDLNVFQERLEGYSAVRLLNWYPQIPTQSQ